MQRIAWVAGILALAGCGTGGVGGGLEPPGNAVAAALSTNSVQLSWEASSQAGVSYAIERRMGNGGFEIVGNSASTSFTDVIPNSGRTYAYRIRATGNSANSDWVNTNEVPVPGPCASGSSNVASRGCFGSVVSTWPLVPTFTALLPNGKVVAWYASDDVGKYREDTDKHNTNPRAQGGLGTEDKSQVTVWNPALGGDAQAFEGANLDQSGGKGTDLFCAGYTVLSDGKLLAAGGNIGLTYGSIRMNLFDPGNRTWEKGPGPKTPNMWRDRWYPTLTKLPDGKVLITGGTAINDPSFVEGSSPKETANADASRVGQNICRTPNGVCPAGLQGTSNPNPPNTLEPPLRGIRGNGRNTGYNNAFEVYDPQSGNLTMLTVTAADIPAFEHYYPWWHVMPNGNVFLAGASYQKRVLNVSASQWASGLIDSVGQRPYGTSVMYRPDRVMVIGGGYAFGGSAALDLAMSKDANTTLKIALNGNSPSIASGPNMNYRRTHAMSTLLADGRVFVHGGQQNGGESGTNITWARSVNEQTIWNLDLAVRTSEIYNPATDSFQLAARSNQERMYHSIALLLPDASVLTAGGGGCGLCIDPNIENGGYGALDAPSRFQRGTSADTRWTERQNRTNKKNHEIYYPPYLFRANGSLAPRPIIASLSATQSDGYSTLAYDSSFSLTWAHPEPGRSISKVNFIALGAPTHAFDQNQRFLELSILSQSGNSLSVRTPSAGMYGASSARNIAPPGFYMVFILDDQGVPSVARIVRIQ